MSALSDLLMLQPEQLVLLQSFGVGLVLLLVLERLLPARPAADGSRTLSNISLQLINAVMIFLLPVGLVASALFALFNQIGLFNQPLGLGLWTRIAISLLIMDLGMYWLHRAYHHFGFLWRFHRVHHTDQSLDLSTTFRTHPVETLITLSVRAGFILLLGVPLIGVILYEIIVAFTAMFIHSNLRLLPAFDRVLGLLLITPSRHRLHHDLDPALMKSNFGLVLSVWDRLFGTLTTLPESRSRDTIGLPGWSQSGLLQLLLSPSKTKSQH